ncbi:hypothetical protein BV22DRAFT_1040272 [Leucogyrophana mollusca]|uniref:Uncharacterized protein n=1 Tax=Leucogyrophana mollusca TaxID=85980 RepID=A0ACB8B4C3_9AGAM|nr:hypothetical protein BV22DRAFT_1040272 [Leucogyrophana mollusca]
MSGSQPIILYDIPCQVAGHPWSPNTMKIRYTLGYKNLPFTTTWLEYPEIEPHMRALGAARTPHPTLPGQTLYTLPVIEDPRTGAVVSDSLAIAAYLDKTYPDTPIALRDPPATDEFVAAFLGALKDTVLFMSVVAAELLNPVSAEYYKRTRAERYARAWEELSPPGPVRDRDWRRMEEGWNVVDGWYRKNEGKYFLGHTPSFADFVVVSRLKWCQFVFGEQSEEWKNIAGWNEGRWGELVRELERYFPL